MASNERTNGWLVARTGSLFPGDLPPTALSDPAAGIKRTNRTQKKREGRLGRSRVQGLVKKKREEARGNTKRARKKSFVGPQFSAMGVVRKIAV